MRVVLDTNVLVSGILSPHGPPAAVLRALFARRLELCLDERILAEYRDVLTRGKFSFNEVFVKELIGFFEETGYSIVAPPVPIELPDPTDRMFIEVAVAGRADYLITGNLKHYPEDAAKRVSVISPREFLDLGVL